MTFSLTYPVKRARCRHVVDITARSNGQGYGNETERLEQYFASGGVGWCTRYKEPLQQIVQLTAPHGGHIFHSVSCGGSSARGHKLSDVCIGLRRLLLRALSLRPTACEASSVRRACLLRQRRRVQRRQSCRA